VTLRDKLIYALMFLEIGDDTSICDAHDLITSALHNNDIPNDTAIRLAERVSSAIIYGVFYDDKSH
jgi:hypothetical protein